MTISLIISNGFRKFAPDVLFEPYYSFFDFLVNDDLTSNESIIQIDQLKKNYRKYIKETRLTNEKSFTTKNFDAAVSPILKKLHSAGFLGYDNHIITQINLEELRQFFKLLKFTKNSQDRIIRWGIFYLFNSGKSINKFNDIQNLLNEFKIPKINYKIKKITDDARKNGLDIEYVKDDSFKIKHKLSDNIVVKCLLEDIEFYSRRSPGQLEQEILEFLDHGSYSNQEIEIILEANKSLVSRIMKKLKKERLIVHHSFGNKGVNFFTTNCDKCPFNTTRESCRKKSIDTIIYSLNDYGINSDRLELENYDNQTLLSINDIFVEKMDQTHGIQAQKNMLLDKIFDQILREMADEVYEKNKKLKLTSKEFTNEQIVRYSQGFFGGSKYGFTLAAGILGKILQKTVNKKDQERIVNEFIKAYNELLKNVKKSG